MTKYFKRTYEKNFGEADNLILSEQEITKEVFDNISLKPNEKVHICRHDENGSCELR